MPGAVVVTVSVAVTVAVSVAVTVAVTIAMSVAMSVAVVTGHWIVWSIGPGFRRSVANRRLWSRSRFGCAVAGTRTNSPVARTPVADTRIDRFD